MKTLLQKGMYYVREYTPTCRFLKIINSTFGVYSPLHNNIIVSFLNPQFSKSSGINNIYFQFLSMLSVPDEDYFRNASCALNLISTFL
jgi:hypothetical protein